MAPREHWTLCVAPRSRSAASVTVITGLPAAAGWDVGGFGREALRGAHGSAPLTVFSPAQATVFGGQSMRHLWLADVRAAGSAKRPCFPMLLLRGGRTTPEETCSRFYFEAVPSQFSELA